MNLLFALFFGAGVAAWTYSKFGRRLGYSNTKNQVTLSLVIFFISSIVFFTVFTTFLK